MNLAATGVNLQTANFSHFPRGRLLQILIDALLLVMMQRQLIGQPAKDWS
jgi:hypothetical protein